MELERTLVILKPDAVARRLVGRIISRFEEKGLIVAAMKLVRMDRETAARHYDEHKAKPFFPQLLDFITSGPVVIIAVEGVEAIPVVRKLVGATSGRAAESGSIRGDFGMSKSFNLIHASDSPGAAKRELDLFFAREDFIPPAAREQLAWNYEFSEGGPN